MMQIKEWTKITHNAQLDVGVLYAHFVKHAYPRHSHDYYVISLIERGRQSFTHKGKKYTTPPGGVILINPDAVHTGEAVDSQGFELRSIYPTISHMQRAYYELTGHSGTIPLFAEVRVDHPWAARSVLSLHHALSEGKDVLECESRFIPFGCNTPPLCGESSLGLRSLIPRPLAAGQFIHTLTQLIKHCANAVSKKHADTLKNILLRASGWMSWLNLSR